ncbi:21 [Symbiodinium microadriaticum]|nr:21 [Symbiodinium microadriaticum]
MAHRRKKKTVRMGDAEYGLYNFDFPKSLQPKDTQPVEFPSLPEPDDVVEESPKQTVDPTGDNMAEEHVERFITEDGREAVKITRNETDYHSNTKVVEVFEDKVTPHVLTKRITEYTKPVVFKIKTELVDEHGNVVEVIIEELDENSDDFKMVKSHEEVEVPEVKAQSVEVKEPVVKHVKMGFGDMRALSLERNRFATSRHLDSNFWIEESSKFFVASLCQSMQVLHGFIGVFPPDEIEDFVFHTVMIDAVLGRVVTMRRKLIQQDAFDKMTNQSVKNAERELVEAQDILARALSENYLTLHSFTDSTVLFENTDGTFVHASYDIDDNHLTFNNIEELVIDESSRKAKMRGILSDMLEHILKDETPKAQGLFNDYLEMVNWNEAKDFEFVPKSDSDDDDDDGDKPSKKKMPFGEKKKRKDTKDKKDKFPFGKKKADDDDKMANLKKAEAAGKELKEAYICAHNVLDYVNYMRVGPALAESVSKSDDNGSVTNLKIPTSKLRNASKLMENDWRLANKRVKSGRDKAFALAESEMFGTAMSDLRRQNAFSDKEALEEVLENVAQAWPELLYVTESELARMIGHSLEESHVRNYDDETCQFMAEGVLYKIHEAYTDRVAQILHLARATSLTEDVHPYVHFKNVVEGFYPAIDEKFGLERKVFEDLYESLEAVWKKADRTDDKALKTETASYLNELAAVLNDKVQPDLDLAEEAAEFLGTVIETNLSMGKWVVSNKPHLTVSGDHPDMAKKAAHGYTPAKDASGDWGDVAPMISQDNMSYKGNAPEQARTNSWASPKTGGGDVFPKLSNPYVPKPFGDYTMKGEKGVDKDAYGQHWSTWQTGDVWPGLNNPYVPQEAGGPGGTGHKMKDGKFQEAEAINKNKRMYPYDVLDENLHRLMECVDDRRLVGELDHPTDSIIHFANASHVVTKLWWEGNVLMGEGEILNTPHGKVLKALINDGIKVGISSRGVGNGKVNEDGILVIGESYKLITFDAVADPSTFSAFQEKVRLMSKITEALKTVIPAEQISEVTAAVEAMMAEQNEALKAEYKSKLEEAYEEFEDEKQALEAVMEQGYQQAYEIIAEMQHRLDTQREEFEQALEEGFEEAYHELQKEKSKNTDIEVDLYDEFDNRLKEMKEFFVDKIDRFLTLQEKEIYESAKRDVLDDPQMLEHRVALDKVAQAVSGYLSEDVAGVSMAEVEKAYKVSEELKGQLKIIESRNMRLTMQNNKLNEQVKEANGQRAMGTQEQILSEYANPEAKHQRVVSEGADSNPLNDLLVLSGIPMDDDQK